MKKSLYSSNFIIRNAVFDDIGLLRDIYRRASLSVEADRDLFAAHPEWLVWDDKMLPFTCVAVVNGRVVGFASARPVNGCLELEDLFTDPEWMRQGVASALIQDIARRGVRVEVTASPQAIGFYEAAGFIANGFANTEGGPAPRMYLDVTRTGH
ncbi:GNAT family N-acetyltransferase [Paenibacillus sp. FSL K6-1096]|uniref:GNAT family N-acetyltransferase n=1 Tax=Paenibacillus sp. FSL K6-1096 TaxID=2921460 RepID=UPI0030EF94B6